MKSTKPALLIVICSAISTFGASSEAGKVTTVDAYRFLLSDRNLPERQIAVVLNLVKLETFPKEALRAEWSTPLFFGSLFAFGNDDPYFGFQIELTNNSPSEEVFSLRATLQINDTMALAASEIFTTWTVFDTNDDGVAYINNGQATAWLGTDKGVFSPVAKTPLDPNFVPAFSLFTTDEASVTPFDVIDVPADPTSSDFNNSTSFTDIEFLLSADPLSPGDTVRIRAYACIADSTQSICPEKPDFDAITAPIPIPSAIWLFGSALLGAISWSRCNWTERS